ncbi:MAG: DUF1553 domain-containing protein [Roseibacillus sp.]|nr:DUF1553 domain-containing protein [Roseibacillus sp.]
MKEKSKTTGSIHSSVTPFSLRLAALLLLALLPHLRSIGETETDHWAFLPPRKSSLPGAINPIDHFVHERLKKAGLSPSSRAPSHTLIRRLSFDLRGIPPTQEEVERFRSDTSPGAWSKLVERFLASPHFGERLAQNWLDLARYADTSGYAADRTRNMWVYRDWVINSINRDEPFDQFTIAQIAGDLLPGASASQKVATGFHRNAMQAKGNNPRKEEFRIKTVADRLKTTGRTWLGLTLECAECHDHKHDPISQEEYYQLFAIFNNVPHLGAGYNTHGPLMDYVPENSSKRGVTLRSRIAALRKTLPDARSPEDPALLGTWSKGHAETNPSRFAPTGDLTISAVIRTREKVADIASKYDWKSNTRSFVFGIGGEAQDNSRPGHLFAWISSTNETWNGAEIHGSIPVNDGREHHVAVVFTAGQTLKLYIDGIEDKAARLIGNIPKSISVSTRPLAIGAGYTKSITPNAFLFRGELGKVRIYRKALADPGQVGPAGAEIRKLETELADLQTAPLKVHVMDELPRPRETHILIRGNYKDKGPRVFPAVPAVLPAIAGGKNATRLDFARWLFQPEHPLTSRVAVNYLWQHFFGKGLVATSADFGVMGEKPSHLELLDWLAIEFESNGWSRKDLVRLIVNSETYRQSSVQTPRQRAADPANRLLSRMSRSRHAAEQIRDNALAISGLLVHKVGGPPVFPSQPEGLYEETGQNEPGNSNFTWKDSTGDDRHRKSMYTYWKRMLLHPSLASFDAPSRQVCVTSRSATNTPRQALVTLNDPIFHECARFFAERITASHPGKHQRLEHAFQTCLSRSPDAEERKMFLTFLAEEGEGADGWISVAAILLNLDETLTRE